MKLLRTLGWTGLATSLAIVAFSLWRLAYPFLFPSKETIDPHEYPAVLRQWKNTKLVDHFPVQIPSEARDVRLSSYPGFLQGGGWFQVRMELPADQAAKVLSKHRPSAIKEFQGGEKTKHYNECQVASTDFFTSGTKEREFPDSFLILVLGNGGGWNHGTSQGVAIDPANNLVIYWAENW